MGCFKDVIEPVIGPVLDVAAAATGNPELIPLIQAGVGAGESLASGKAIGSSLLTGAEQGGIALAGQEAAGAFGIGSGNTAFNNALGINISPSATGLPDIGSALGFGSSPNTGGASPASGASASSSPSGITTSLSGTSGTPGASGVTGGGAAATPAAPAGAAPSGDVTLSADQSFLNSGGSASGTGSGSAGIQSAADSNFTNASPGSTFGSGSGSGSSTSGAFTPPGSNPSGSVGNTAADSNFLAGSPPSAPTANAGQGPTVANAANLSNTTAPAGNSVVNAFKDPSVSSIGTALGNNANILTSLAGLGTDAVKGMQTPKGQSQLLHDANSLDTLAKQNESYLGAGTLPPGAQASINQATQSAIAAIKSKYASMGMAGSSAEQEEIAATQTKAQTDGINIAMNLMQQGASEAGMASGIYEQIMSNSMKNDQQFSSAFTNLASATGGGKGA